MKNLGEELFIEAKYFEKYKDVMNQKDVTDLIEEYKSQDIIFEPIRNKLTETDLERLYKQIDDSDFLSSQEKAKTIIGLMMVLDGSFPDSGILSFLERVFGGEFMDTIKKTEEKFTKEIAIKKMRKLLKFIKENYKQLNNK